VDIYLTEPVGPFPTAAGAAFGTFTTKKDVSPFPLPVIPAGKLRRGSKVYVKAAGEYSTTGAPTLRAGFYHGIRSGATITADIAVTALAAPGGTGAAAWPWWMEWDGFLNSDPGTTATLLGQGQAQFGASISTFNTETPIPITQALRTVTIDTTIERAIGVSWEWGTSSASNTVTTNFLRVLILN